MINLFKKNKKLQNEDNIANINEWSFQRYAKFYGNMILRDENFIQKMEIITDLVVRQKVEDIYFIAEEAGCTYEECILKIKYLKNKLVIGDLYIDHLNGVLKKCSDYEQSLLDKYNHFLYSNHFSLEDMALQMPQTSSLNIEKQKDIIFQELCYLDDRSLINGIILNRVDKKIIYYSVEKHKKEKDLITINCPNCGAINDVNRGGKARCEYCGTIIEDTTCYN